MRGDVVARQGTSVTATANNNKFVNHSHRRGVAAVAVHTTFRAYFTDIRHCPLLMRARKCLRPTCIMRGVHLR